MRYKDYKCDGCSKVFTDEDDIVVCPECATPQHRECYNEKGGCVNAHLHSEDFQWQGEKDASAVAAAPVEEKAEEEIKNDLICPNCKHPNPHGSTACRKCGLKFTIFGFNLAQAAQQEDEKETDDLAPINPDAEPKMTPPPYPPPFTVGKGEDNDDTGLPFNREEQIENFLSHTISNASGYDTAENEEQLFKGPFPDDMKVDGIPANTMGAFLAKDSGKYIRKFRSIASGNRISFNWAAFFFSPYWFFYRKMYKPGIIFMTLQLCVNIIATPSASAFLEFSEYMSGLDYENMTEAAATELMTKMDELMYPMFLVFGLLFILKLVAGFIGNHLYRNYTVSQLKAVEAEQTKNQKLTRILKFGGISTMMPLAAYFAEQLLSMIASSFF